MPETADAQVHARVHAIVCDGYDRDVLARLLRTHGSVKDARARLARLLPHPEPLICDLFSALYKLNVELRPAEELSGAVLLNRRFVASVLASRDLAALRARTQLDEDECAVAVAVLVDRIIAAARRDFRIGPEQLLEASQIAEDEAERAEREEELSQLEQLGEGAFGDDERAALTEALSGEIAALSEQIAAARARQEALADRLGRGDLDDSIALKVSTLPEQLEGAESELRSMGLGAGGDGRVGAARRLELGERLLKSRKLQLLAKLVGAFREVAFEARRRRIARSPQALHSIAFGRDLDRLLPAELLGLRKDAGGLHTEFLRRYAEGQLSEYELHGAAERGPMVVCVDGSGSMRGSKELWAKAVALTLMEIARREKRRCLAIVFSAGDELFEVELLATRSRAGGRPAVQDDNVLAFAEHFPGGGTDFEEPMRRALDAVATGRYRRGDVVFITDGHAHVSQGLIDAIEEGRRRHRFRVRGICVDVADSTAETLARFCDDVRRVTDLTADSLGDLFASV